MSEKVITDEVITDEVITDEYSESEKRNTSVQNVSSAPPYISDFIGKNMDKLLEIYDEGLKENGEGALRMICSQKEGCLGFVCNQETNKMDVMFFNEENLQLMITKESWTDLKYSRGEKKLLICQDCDLNSIFLIFL